MKKPNFFKRLLGVPKKPTTVSEVLADFQSKIADLNHVNESREAIASANDEHIVNLHKQNADHRIEAAKAKTVCSKLESLLA